jgi:serine/threonine protein kinase
MSRHFTTYFRLGRGTFGAVVLAHDRSSGFPAAVKIIKLHDYNDPPDERERRRALIKREVRLMRGIEHVSTFSLFDNARTY